MSPLMIARSIILANTPFFCATVLFIKRIVLLCCSIVFFRTHSLLMLRLELRDLALVCRPAISELLLECAVGSLELGEALQWVLGGDRVRYAASPVLVKGFTIERRITFTAGRGYQLRCTDDSVKTLTGVDLTEVVGSTWVRIASGM